MFEFAKDPYFWNFLFIMLLSGIFLICYVFLIKQFGTWIWPIGTMLKGYIVYPATFLEHFPGLAIVFFLFPWFLLIVGDLTHLIIICISGFPIVLWIGMMLIVDRSLNPSMRIPVRSIIVSILTILLHVCFFAVISKYLQLQESITFDYFVQVIQPELFRKVLPLYILLIGFICANLGLFLYRYSKRIGKPMLWLPVLLLCTITLTFACGIVFSNLKISTKEFVHPGSGLDLSRKNTAKA